MIRFSDATILLAHQRRGTLTRERKTICARGTPAIEFSTSADDPFSMLRFYSRTNGEGYRFFCACVKAQHRSSSFSTSSDDSFFSMLRFYSRCNGARWCPIIAKSCAQKRDSLGTTPVNELSEDTRSSPDLQSDCKGHSFGDVVCKGTTPVNEFSGRISRGSRSSTPMRHFTVTSTATLARISAIQSATRSGLCIKTAPKAPDCTRSLGQPQLRLISS